MISAFFAKWGVKLLAVLAAVGTALGGLAIYGRGKKKEGASEERGKTQEKVIDAVKEKVDLDRKLDDADARRKLRNKHYRD